MGDLLITGIGELVTNAPEAPEPLGLVDDAAIVIRGGRIAWIGRERGVPKEHRRLKTLDVEGRAALPGFVDAHTHLVFAGDRADEFTRRLQGESYEDVLGSGGGIRSTVRATRAASMAQLVAESAPRLRRLLEHGTTTVEIKSGYGLDAATEKKQLEAIARLRADSPVDVVPTFLGAHVLPEEYVDDRDGFLEVLINVMTPMCAPYAHYCDVFCDNGAFTVDEARRILATGRRYGLAPRVHANELGASGGAGLAAEIGAVSADHLVHVGDRDLRALAAAGTVAVLLPATTFSLRTTGYAPGDAFWAHGVTVALATDCNPGTSYTESMPFVIALACIEMGLTPEQAVWAATRGGALALEMQDRGMLLRGTQGDVIVLDAPSYRHLPYRAGTNLVRTVVKGGEVVVDRS